MAGIAGADFPGGPFQDVQCIGSGFPEIMGGSNDCRLPGVTIPAHGTLFTLSHEQVLLRRRIVRLMTGPAHQLSFPAEKDRLPTGPG